MLEVIFGCWFLVGVINSWMLFMNSLIMFLMYLLFNMYEDGESILKLIMILLSLWLTMMMMMTVSIKEKTINLLMIFLFMIISLMILFYSETMLFFYLGFEMSIIPILMIIFGWGYQPDRLDAGVYMIMYTVFFSLPLLLGIFFLEKLNFINNFLMYLMFTMAFFAKFPMFGFHLWLPRAHVEAPVYGSMILAGVMLKLGGYGMIKISLVLGDLIHYFSSYWIIFSILGGMILSGVCFTQSDMKLLVAYSSVVHMSIVLSGLMTLSEIGLNGSVYLMVGHGLCSSGLFCVVGLLYNRTLTRSMYLTKGIVMLMSVCSLWWFLFCSCNLSFPPCLNLPGELFLFTAILSWSNYLFMFMGILGVLSSMYSIYMFSITQQGLSTNYYSFKPFNLMESLLLFLHWFPLNIFILDLEFLSMF